MNYVITKGLDLKLSGGAPDSRLDFATPDTFFIRPSDFRWMTPKLLVQAGDRVRVGTPLFCDKKDGRVVIVSPVGGTVREIVRGAKRVVEALVVDKVQDSDPVATVDFADPAEMQDVRGLLLRYGLWPCLRQRPFSVIPSPDVMPKAVFVPCFDSNPLAPEFNVLLRGKEEDFLFGLQMLRRAAGDVPVHLCLHKEADNRLFEKAESVQKHYFSGPHPSGNVGTHIHLIDPLDKGETVWYMDPQEVARIGAFFRDRRLDFAKTAALTGPAAGQTGYYTAVYGADLSGLLKEELDTDKKRVISGSVLSGNMLDAFPVLGFHDRQITVLDEGGQRELFGWLLPGFRKWSLSRTFLAWLTPKRTYAVNTSLQGGRRAFMMTDVYEKVFPFDLMPLQLLKACEIKDLEQMEALGIYEVDSEDFALCELVCPSKKECQKIVEDAIFELRTQN